MFQNIIQDEVQEEIEINSNVEKKSNINFQNITLCIVTFFASMVSFGSGIAPFGVCIFAAACSNKIPAIFVCVAAGLGTLVGFGGNAFLGFVLVVLLFLIQIAIFKPKSTEENRNEKRNLGLYLFIATFLVQASQMLFSMFLVYDLLVSIMAGAVTYIFYKIFSNSLIVINEFKIKNAFSIEEVIGASLLLAVALSAFSGITISGFSITNIFSIMLVLMLGWKHGMLVGATSGITIGVVLGIINLVNPTLVAAYAISGMIAGILNKLGKIGVIIGFVGGNAILTYLVNGNTVPIITIQEILIASLGLLFLPKKIEFNIENILSNVKLLPVAGTGVIEGSSNEDTVYKLNSVSETISAIAKSYNEAASTVEEEAECEKHKDIFKAKVINNLEEHEQNILYDDLVDLSNSFLDKIYNVLEQKDELQKEELIKIFEDSNSYIIGLENDEISKQVNKDIDDIIKLLNNAYQITKLDIIWNQKVKESKKNMSSQLNGVSEVISSLATDITNTKTVLGNPTYKVQIGSSRTTKNGSQVSGDSSTQIKLHDGKYMMAISDGMGSGPDAKKSSSSAIRMLERLLTTGFDKDASLKLINSTISLGFEEDMYSSIDIGIIDLVKGNIEFIKNGAAPSYIKHKNGTVEIIKSLSLPVGILNKIDLVVYDKDLEIGDIIVMCSDGIMESNTEYSNKEVWVRDVLEGMKTNHVQKIADILIGEAIDNGYGIAKDDMTVFVARIDEI
ncbi:MAG: SpoIIE family protein phosphatase [Lachnospiraceae bacterium]|jgi:stage II sporulation protein E|nr:SpoIIE family protein phosphatase [Lachnospiraceae bacterium]